jgi:hypothetical protein
MKTENLIAINELCINHNIEISFINSIQKSGLIEFTIIEDSLFIGEDQLQQLEKIVHFYYELDINLEGIETINHLLQRINSLQDEILMLKNRLRLYEKFE